MMRRFRPIESLSDAELLREASVDPEAFTVLYRRHVSAVHGWFAYRIRWAASDLTAETFSQAWLSRAQFQDRRGGSALPWLLGIAANLLATSARRDRVETRARERLGLPVDLYLEDGFEAVDKRLSPRQALEEQLAALPAHERDALELRVVGDKSFAEVATELRITPVAARLRVSRALRRLACIVSTEDL